MAWSPYPDSFFIPLPTTGQGGQSGSASLPYSAAQLSDPRVPQSIRDQMQAAQQAQAAGSAYLPHTSMLATAAQGLSGLLGGQGEAAANAAAAPYTGQSNQVPQPSPSLLASLLRNGGSGSGSTSSPGIDDPSASTPPAAGWAGVGQGLAAGAQQIGRKSDRRLKFDVVRIGTTRGLRLPVYRYRLEGSPVFEVGVMADEVALVRPGAVWTDPGDGWARVDYARIF